MGGEAPKGLCREAARSFQLRVRVLATHLRNGGWLGLGCRDRRARGRLPGDREEMAEMEQRRRGLFSPRAVACAAALLLLGSPAGAAPEKPAPKPASLSPTNPGFEKELVGWTLERPLSPEQGRVSVVEIGRAHV